MDPATIAASRLSLGTVSLGQGLTLSPRLALYPPTLHLIVSFDDAEIWDATFDLTDRRVRWAPSLGPVGADLEIDVDLERGEITARGELSLGEHRRSFESEVVARWAPMLGRVGGAIEAHPPPVVDPAGPVRSVLPVINRIPIDETERLGTDVGARVKRIFFPTSSDFVFNVCFAVGPAPDGGPGTYGDPESPWFNVFCGYYQIDCLKRDWDRPFGYRPGPTGALEVDYDEVTRIGKADWNYLSNWMYGVPAAAVAPHDGVDPCTRPAPRGRRIIGATAWDVVDVDHFSVATAFESGAPGAARLEETSILTPLWRAAFGGPSGREDDGPSFPAALMRARFYMAWSEDADAYHTCLFGGTVNKAFDGPDNDAFLDAQMAAVEQVIAATYPDLGFAPRGGAPAADVDR